MHFKEEVIGPITDDNDVEASDCEDTDEDLTIIPTTDIPEVILVEEDEFTEKINESTEIFDNIKQVQLSLDEAVKENKVNESQTMPGASLPKVETSQKECVEDFDVQVVETKFDQPEVEIINAADTIVAEEPSSPTTPRYSDHKETDHCPPPPKIAFQEESSISQENYENSAKTEAENNLTSSEMVPLGRSLEGGLLSIEIFPTVFQRVTPSSRRLKTLSKPNQRRRTASTLFTSS